MGEVRIIGLDPAKTVFVAFGAFSIQMHGAGSDGPFEVRRKLSRGQVLKFPVVQPPCLVGTGGLCQRASPGRAIRDLGRALRLIRIAYVKPCANRQKTDMADAEAIAEAASRPTLRLVA